MKNMQLLLILLIMIIGAIALYFLKFKKKCEAYVLQLELGDILNLPDKSTFMPKFDELSQKNSKLLIAETMIIASTEAELIPFKKLLSTLNLKTDIDIQCANENELQAFQDFKIRKVK